VNKHPKRASQLAICLGMTKYALRATSRNKAGYFFSLIFPLLFVCVFGLFSGGRQPIKLGVSAALDRSSPVYQALSRIAEGPDATIRLVQAPDADLHKRLLRGDIAAILGAPADGRSSVALVTSDANPGGKSAAYGTLAGLLDKMSLEAAGVTEPAFRMESRDLPGREFRHIDFILPGQLGFSMLSLATFGIAFNLLTLRKTLVLKRMMATQARPLTFVIAQGISRSVQAVVQSAIIIGLGVVAFHFTLARGWVSAAEMMFLCFLGIMAFIGYGILICNIARDEQTLPIALNLFNLPQMLLAGVFFPIDGMPAWVRAIGNNLPLAYLTTSLRKVASEGAGLLELWPYVLGMFAWAAASYIIAAKTFRTE
jgi:ABC-2 type transport system permease protein